MLCDARRCACFEVTEMSIETATIIRCRMMVAVSLPKPIVVTKAGTKRNNLLFFTCGMCYNNTLRVTVQNRLGKLDR